MLLATIGIVLGVILLAGFLLAMFILRRVVPTNMVHIVQSSTATTSYGKGRETGNTYYAIPSWVPKFGVTVTEFPESIFKVSLSDYEAYDQARLPFMVDVTAFFRVEKSETAAQRVSSFKELQDQLDSVLKGAVRRILATNALEHIMEARADLGAQFTKEVNEQIKEWGVCTVKTIEFMDLRDSKSSGSKVIHNIMAKEQSRIDRESRTAVAANQKDAELAEILASQAVEIQKQEAQQQVGIRTAEKEKVVGISREQAKQDIQEQAALTAAKTMEVKRVELERGAEIDKSVAITQAEAQQRVHIVQAEAAKSVRITAAQADREAQVLESEGQLTATKNDAVGIQAKGEAEAKAQELLLLAPVTAQTTLAKEIGGNEGYQQYLITLRQVEASQAVGTAMAAAIEKSDLKIIANGGGQGAVQESVAGLADMFTAKGGTSITGMLAALAQTAEGKALLAKVTGKAAE